MKVKSFGCSLIFGNELADDGRDLPLGTPSQYTWPALISQEVDADYYCFAKPGAGNFRILEQIMHQAGLNESDVFFIIGWTWIDRFDYIVDGNADSTWREHWETITPTTESETADFYHRHFSSELRDKIQSLIFIKMAVDLLRSKNIPFIMTCIDDLILDRKWHIPVSVTDTQDYVKPYLRYFQGKNFLDWSRDQGFPIGQWLHPLEEAHEAAAKLMMPLCQQILKI
jgi:hypothetical protein